MTVFKTVLERGEVCPSLNLAVPSMASLESEASRFTFLRFAPSLRNPASLGYQPKPSVVWAFAAPIPRLTLLRSKARGPPSMADPFAGT
ncbi:MAG: hypothetical protein V3S33_02730, partial [Gammaproteobacteria bacterium]